MDTPSLNTASFPQPLCQWFIGNCKPYPWRFSVNGRRDPYRVWLSEVMLQQTTIKAVLPIYERFLEKFPNISSVAVASEEEIRSAVRGLGYYRRFSLFHRGCRELISRQPFRWPADYREWHELSGVGDYTAAAISSLTTGDKKIALDGNIGRVLCRILGFQSDPRQPEIREKLISYGESLIPSEGAGVFNEALMALGQEICRPENPDCEHCPVSEFCNARFSATQHLCPARKISTPPVPVELSLVIVFNDDKIALFERSSGARFLKNQWGFWTFESQELSALPKNVRKLKSSFSHSITNHRIRCSVYVLDYSKNDEMSFPPLPLRWFPINSAEEFLVSNLDRKALGLFQKLA